MDYAIRRSLFALQREKYKNVNTNIRKTIILTFALYEREIWYLT
jgi:hypothetical protein